MEYVKLTHDEKILGKKVLLTSQINIIRITKRIKKYQELRNEETAAKIILKRKVAEIIDELKNLKKILPKEKNPKEIKEKTDQKRHKDLELEIEEIKRKIERLQ